MTSTARQNVASTTWENPTVALEITAGRWSGNELEPSVGGDNKPHTQTVGC